MDRQGSPRTVEKRKNSKVMSSLETYLANAPECAQGIVNQWGQMSRGMQWTAEFDSVLDLACKYLDAKKHREHYEHLETIEGLKGKLRAEIAEARADEVSKQRAFAESYKAAEERPRQVPPS